MYMRKYDKYYRRIFKHTKFPFTKLKENATGNKSQYSDEEKTLLVIAENMREISYTFNYLNDSRLYLYLNPSSFLKTKIPNARYLNYHMHNYFNNAYILKGRMISFLQRMKKASKDIETKKLVDSFCAIIEKYFEKYKKIRNDHTHIVRYIDHDISTLETFESAYGSSFIDSGKIVKKGHVSMAYSEVKKNWLKFMKTSDIAISNLVSEYFDFIIKLILNKNGSFKILLKKYSYEQNRKNEL